MKSYNLKFNTKNLVTFLFSIISALLALVIPWEIISRDGFSDFLTYIEYFDYFKNSNQSSLSMSEIFEFTSFIQYFTNEFLWFEIISILNNITDDSAISLRIISFVILTTIAYYLIKITGFYFSFIFILNPSVIDVAMSGIRNGFAWALIIIGFFSTNQRLRFLLFIISCFIHSSSLLIIIIFYFIKYSNFLKNDYLFIINILLFTVCTGLGVTLFHEFTLGLINDRRLDSDYFQSLRLSVSAISIWLFLLLLQFSQGKKYVRENIFVIALLVLYITISMYIPWAYRIWACFLPLIIFSTVKLSNWKRQIFYFFYIFYLISQYMYWSKFFYYWND